MTVRPKTFLKTRFENGDKPDQTDFSDLIDSLVVSTTALETASAAAVVALDASAKTTIRALGTFGATMLAAETSAAAQSLLDMEPSVVKATMTAGQTIAAGVSAKVTFDSALIDPRGIFSAVANRVTPDLPGRYLVGCMVQVSGLADGSSVNLRVLKNTEIELTKIERGIGGATFSADILTLVSCNGTTDFLETWIDNASGGGIQVKSATAQSTLHVARFPG